MRFCTVLGSSGWAQRFFDYTVSCSFMLFFTVFFGLSWSHTLFHCFILSFVTFFSRFILVLYVFFCTALCGLSRFCGSELVLGVFGGFRVQGWRVFDVSWTLNPTLTHQNLPCCRARLHNRLGLIIRTYKKVGFGRFRVKPKGLSKWGLGRQAERSVVDFECMRFLLSGTCCRIGLSTRRGLARRSLVTCLYGFLTIEAPILVHDRCQILQTLNASGVTEPPMRPYPGPPHEPLNPLPLHQTQP